MKQLNLFCRVKNYLLKLKLNILYKRKETLERERNSMKNEPESEKNGRYCKPRMVNIQ